MPHLLYHLDSTASKARLSLLGPMAMLRSKPAYERLADSGDLGDGCRESIELPRHKRLLPVPPARIQRSNFRRDRTASSTDFDDILNKPSSFDEDASQRDAELLPERRPHPSRISGWRVGALGAAIITICVMLFNVAITTWIMTHPDYRDDDDGWRIMFEGSCQTAKETSRWVHFLINAISTLLLGASNYCMQVLSSPTRSELVRAHSRKIWLHIGVPNTRNLWHIGKDRSLLWILLFLSSVPLHFM